MPVTEIAFLEFTPSVTWTTPNISTYFRLVSQRQSTWSGYPLFFFTDTIGSKITLVAGWESVDAHNGWIASEGNQELLRLLGPYLKVVGLVHLDMNFGDVPEGIQQVKVEKLEGDNGEAVGGAKAWSVVAKAVDAEGSYRISEGEGLKRVDLDQLSE